MVQQSEVHTQIYKFSIFYPKLKNTAAINVENHHYLEENIKSWYILETCDC